MMQRIALTVGLLVLAGAWLGPLPALAERAFAAHMTMHMAVVAVAAPLIALGVAGGHLDPVRRAPAIFSPIPASLLEFVVVWAWHAPALHDAARHHTGALVLEQATFAGAGLGLWLSALGGEPGPRRPVAESVNEGGRRAAGVLALLLTFMHMTLLGALLALTPRSLYLHIDGMSGLTSLADQHLGGTIMLVVGGVSYLAGGLWLMRGLLRRTAIAPAPRV